MLSENEPVSVDITSGGAKEIYESLGQFGFHGVEFVVQSYNDGIETQILKNEANQFQTDVNEMCELFSDIASKNTMMH